MNEQIQCSHGSLDSVLRNPTNVVTDTPIALYHGLTEQIEMQNVSSLVTFTFPLCAALISSQGGRYGSAPRDQSLQLPSLKRFTTTVLFHQYHLKPTPKRTL